MESKDMKPAYDYYLSLKLPEISYQDFVILMNKTIR